MEWPTRESLLAEAALLGDSFRVVPVHPADLLADAEELLRFRSDAPELTARGYDVSDAVYERLALLVGLLRPFASRQAVAEQSLQTVEAEDARLRLLVIGDRLSRIGLAAGLPVGLCSLAPSDTTRLNMVAMRIDDGLAAVKAHLHELPDRARVQELVLEARALIDAHKDSRRAAHVMPAQHSREADTAARLERLLLDTLQHLSRQGLAAYPDDPSREPAYLLEHVGGRRASRAGDPHAGGPPKPRGSLG